MKKNKKISIIIPIYNGEKFLNRCLESIINQTYNNFEIIIINDGSTDRTQDIIEKYAKKDSRIITINKKNSGVSDSRNLGILEATGDYITFVDADDWLEKNTLDSINRLLENEYDVIRYNYFKNYSDGIQKENKYDNQIANKKLEKVEIEKKVLPQILSGAMPAYVWLLMIRKDIVEKIEKFNINLAMMEDTVFYINMLTNIENMYISNENLYHYYYDLNSASHSFKNAMRNLNNIILVNKIESNIICTNNLDIKNNMLITNTAHANMIEDICFIIFKNYSINETKENIYKICNNVYVHNILQKANINSIPIHRRIGVKLIKKKKIYLLMIYYKIRKIFYHLKNQYTKRIIN